MNGKLVTFTAGKDFKYDYGTYDYKSKDSVSILKLEACGNYTFNTESVYVYVSTKPHIKRANISYIQKLAYTGKTVDPEISITYNKKTLKERTDYELHFADEGRAVGTHTVYVRGMGDFFGEVKLTYKVVGTPISKATFTLDSGETKIATKTYNGADQKVGFKLTYLENPDAKPRTLKGIEASKYEELPYEKKITYDYIYGYKNNRKKGTAKLIICGVTGYTEVMTKTFTIGAYDIAQENSAFKATLSKSTYIKEKGAVKPEPVVTFKAADGKTYSLTKGVDYTVSYSGNKKKGTAKIKITGKGNFKGTIVKTFVIE